MLTITLLSLVAAAASGFVAWRVVRREHLRSDARVALLASAIDDAPVSPHDFAWRRGVDVDRPVPVAALFDTSAQPSIRRRPLLTAAGGLAVVLAVVVLIAMTSDRYANPKLSATAPTEESLELLSMRSTHKGTTLAVTGLVRNRSSKPVAALTAVVSALDAEGHTVGNGTAVVAPLSPGAESIFLVTIPDVSGVARYRVSFRDTSGVLRHMDRRTGLPNTVS